VRRRVVAELAVYGELFQRLSGLCARRHGVRYVTFRELL
jgi:hypothetical protein